MGSTQSQGGESLMIAIGARTQIRAILITDYYLSPRFT